VAAQLLLDWQSSSSSCEYESNNGSARSIRKKQSQDDELLSRYYRIAGGNVFDSDGDSLFVGEESWQVLRKCAVYGDLLAVDLEAG